MRRREPYLAALRFRFLTRFYDRLVSVLLRERPLKARLVRRADLTAGRRILDLGCGTGTLALMAQREAAGALVVGVDGDLEALALARSKARSERTPLRLCAALAEALPFPDATFDRTLSSLFFHHLTRPSKKAVLAAVRSVLTSSGELHLLDWGRAQDPLMRLLFVLVQLLDGFVTTTDNVRGHLAGLIRDSGFDAVEETHRERSVLGTLSLLRATRAPHRSSPATREAQLFDREDQ